MLLRSYRPTDLPILHQIDQACFPAAVSYSREELANFIGHRRSRTWIAEEDGRIVGFLVADRQMHASGHVITVDVLEEWRHRGVGTQLMEAAEDWARSLGLHLIYLETSEQNVTAQRFYSQRGYEKHRLVERYYGNGEAAWVMLKWLDPRSEEPPVRKEEGEDQFRL